MPGEMPEHECSLLLLYALSLSALIWSHISALVPSRSFKEHDIFGVCFTVETQEGQDTAPKYLTFAVTADSLNAESHQRLRNN